MNRVLAFLLSKVYDNALAPAHRADLEKSGLTDLTVQTAFIRSVPPAMIGQLLGFMRPDIVSAMLLPFRAPGGGFADFARVKVFPTLEDDRGHKVKYLQPRDSSQRLYFTAPALAAIEDAAVPLYLVEGEKKSLAVAQLGLAAVGFLGVEGWHVSGSDNLLPDFNAIRLQGRLVELIPDADVETNPNVAHGVRRFARALQRRGANVRRVILPTVIEAT